MDKKIFQRFYGSMGGRLSEDSMKEIIDATYQTILKFLDKQNKENTLHLIYAGLDMWYYRQYTKLHYPLNHNINQGVCKLSNFIVDLLADFDDNILDLYFRFCDEDKFVSILDEDLEDLHKEFDKVWKQYKKKD